MAPLSVAGQDSYIAASRVLQATAQKCGVDFHEALSAAYRLYTTNWGDEAVRPLQRFEADMTTLPKRIKEMIAVDCDVHTWKNWSASELSEYIQGVRQEPPNRWGKFCQWIACNEFRMDGQHFCTGHELVAMANM